MLTDAYHYLLNPVHMFHILFLEGLALFVPTVTYLGRLCGLVVRVSGYRYRGLGFDSRLPDFLSSSGSGTGSTQPREVN